MLTDDEIFLAIDDVPITKDYVVAVGRAIAASGLAWGCRAMRRFAITRSRGSDPLRRPGDVLRA
jgi:hypothetical protein